MESNVESIFFFLNLHSKIVITFQLSLFNNFIFCISRNLFLSNFLNYHSVLVFGITKYLQFLCPCQKQPLTKITVLYLGKTISGLPGRLLSWSLYRYPLACKNLRTNISGFVFLPLIWLIL